MGSWLFGPVERVPVLPGQAWTQLAVVIERDVPAGLIVPGTTHVRRWNRAPVFGQVEVRQVRTGPVEVRLALEQVEIGDVSAALRRLVVEATVQVADRRRYAGLGAAVRRHGADFVRGLEADLGEDLEAFVRGELRRRTMLAVRDGVVVQAIWGGEFPVAFGDARFLLCRLRTPTVEWSDAIRSFPSVASASVAAASEAPETASEVDETDVLDAVDAASDGTLVDVLGTNPVLLDAWRRTTTDLADPVAIGGVEIDGTGTVLVVHAAADTVPFRPELLSALAAALRVHATRLIVLPLARDVDGLVRAWLDEQAMPLGLTVSTDLDPAASVLRIGIEGDGAAAFVARVDADGAHDLAALAAVLPWSVRLEAEAGP